MNKPISCGTFCRQLYHFQADELSAAERSLCSAHLDECEACARRLEVEEGFSRGLRARLERRPAPPDLLRRVRAELERETPPLGARSWVRAPLLAALAASVVLALLLVPASSGLPWSGVISGVVHVERRATVVDLVCDQAGYTLEQQRGCAHPQHVNALKVNGNSYWSLSLDRDSGRELVTDRAIRGHVLMLEGDFYTGIRTLQVTGYEDLGLETTESRAGTDGRSLALAM